MSYANALKRPAGQTEDNPLENLDNNGEQHSNGGTEVLATPLQWPQGAASGLIKGFCSDCIMENLDPIVCEAWKEETHKVVFIHYLDRGYNPSVAQNVHIISEDLKSKHNPRNKWAKLTETNRDILQSL